MISIADRGRAFLVAAGAAALLAGTTPVHAQTGREDAETACAAGDFAAFFDAFVRSEAARRWFATDAIGYTLVGPGPRVVSTRKVPAKTYALFPIEAVDFEYFPAGQPGGKDHIDFRIDEAKPDQRLVDWARVRYDGEGADGEYLGNRIDRNGRKLAEDAHPVHEGRLTFVRGRNCWILTQDTRYLPNR